MSEEKKEEEKKESEPVAEKEPVQKQGTAVTTPEKEAIQKESAEKGSSAKQKVEKPKNCSRCNKPIKRKTWYYRNGKYFCGKGCWKFSQQKAA